MYREEIILKLRPLLSAHLEKAGFVLVDLRLYRNREGKSVLELLVDRREGGITLDECVHLNRQLGEIVERFGHIQQEYTLDVSSPGLDRPLGTAADFRRAVGRDTMVFLREPVGERLQHQGILESVEEDKIVIKKGEQRVLIPINKVTKAKQVIT